MSTSTSKLWRATVSGMLQHPAEATVFLEHGSDGYALPSLQLDVEWHPIREACRGMYERLGVQVNVLQCARYVSDAEQRHNQFVYGLEIAGDADAADLTCPGRWVGRTELTGLTWAQPDHAALVAAHLAEQATGIPAQRAPWARPGWYAEAAAWIDAALAARGRRRTGDIVPVRSWPLSCVVQAPTADGICYFKAVAHMPLFVDEPVLLEWLGARFPGNVPAPLAIEPQRRWMLMDDWGPSPEESAVELRIRLLEDFARLQQAACQEVDALLAAGCLDRRLAVLADQIQPLLQDARATRDLTEEERRRLADAVPDLQRRCAELAAAEVPQTLVHGDLHTGNVALVDGRTLFYDWTDACIAHPFFDAVENIRQDAEPLCARLRAAYLAAWSHCAPADRLMHLWHLAAPLAYVHLAVSYRFIVASMEPAEQPMLADAIPHYLRLALDALTTPAQASSPHVHAGGIP